MPTALNIITDALTDIGAIDPLESLTAAEASHALTKMNEMLESMSLEGLAVYQILQEAFSTVAGTASYAVGPGPGAAWNTTRPLRIESAFIRASGSDYPLMVLTREEYDTISTKTTQYRSEYLFYDLTVPNGTVYLYGVPGAVYSVYLNSYKQLQQFAALTTSVVLPPGYLRLIKSKLSVELASAYNRTPPQTLFTIATEAEAAVKRLNYRPAKLRLDHAQFTGASGGGFDIHSGS